MTTKEDTPTEGESVTDVQSTSYNGNADGSGRPAPFVQLRTGRFETETVFGRGAEADVSVDGGELKLTVTVTEFSDPTPMLDGDILSVVLAAKDLPDE